MEPSGVPSRLQVETSRETNRTMNQRSLYPSMSQGTSSNSASFNNNTDEELLGVLAQIERSRSQNYTAVASSQASTSSRLPTSTGRPFPSASALAASSAPAATSARAGVASASAHTPAQPSVSLYDELVRYQSEHGIQDENDADILERATSANPTKSSSRSRSASFADDDDDDDDDEEAAVRRSRSELLDVSTHSVHSTSMHSTGTSTSRTGSTTSDRKLPARVPAMSGATYRKPISRNFFSSSKKSRARSFNDGNGSVHDNGIDIDDVNDYHPGKQRSLSPAPPAALSSQSYEGQSSSTSTNSTSMGSVPMPMPSQAQRHSSLPSQTKRQTSSVSDPGDDQFSSEFYDDDDNDHNDHAPLSQLSAREQESVLDQDEALARRLQDEYEGLSRHYSSSTTMKSDEILSRQMEELMREQQDEREPVRGSANIHSNSGQQRQPNSRSNNGQQRQPNQQQHQQQSTSFENSVPQRNNSNGNSRTGMMESHDDMGGMSADEIEEQRRILLQIEEQQARKQHRSSLVTPMSTTNSRRSLTTTAPTPAIPARKTTMPTSPAGDSHEAEEQFRILERIREEQECEELAQVLNLSRHTSPSSPPPPASMAVGAAHGNRRPPFPRVGATWEARQNPNPQRSSISGGATGTESAAEYLQSQHAAMTEYERRGGRPDPNVRSTGNVQRSQSLRTLPVDYNHNQQQYNNNYLTPHRSNANHHNQHNTTNNSYLNSRSSSHHSHQQNHNDDQQQDMVRRGLVETQRAVQEGRAHVVQCQGCGERLQAPVHYSLVYCPTCGVISPGQSAQNNSNNNNNSYNNNSGSSSSAQRGQSFHHEGHNDRYNNNSGSSSSAQRGQSFHHEGHNDRYNNNSGSSSYAQRGQSFNYEGHNDRYNNNGGSSASTQRGQSFHAEVHDNYSNSGSSASTHRGQSFRDEGQNNSRNNNNYNSGSSHSAQRGQGFHHEGHNDHWR
jgi:predicted RNA-binding Zn-ribbon protein involved in translation (DUF1610 family)